MDLVAAPHEQDKVRTFMERVCAESADRLDVHGLCIVVAHPDDETIGCAALLARTVGAAIVVVTDGAPRSLHDARAHGFETAAAYARTRENELRTALSLAGCPGSALTLLGVPDQEAATTLPTIVNALRNQFNFLNIRLVLTHAYEGGHPDHDAVALAVHIAAYQSAQRIGVVEMPLYHASGMQQFVPHPRCPDMTLHLTGAERAIKQAMIAAHQTQAEVLRPFSVEVERFRVAPKYDFTRPAHGGAIRYDGQAWGLKSEQWLMLAREALRRFQFGERT